VGNLAEHVSVGIGATDEGFARAIERPDDLVGARV
jgi:hypothetical protein